MFSTGIPALLRSGSMTALTLTLLVPASALAQAATPPAGADTEIVVTGIRASIEKSLELKRSSEGVVDAITSEDMGKFPDQNVAEALQRVTGISISRDRGEGTTITIRGLGGGFARTTVNGRDLVSGSADRSFNFNVFASEYVSALEVYKTAQPDMVEGGIGGIVNVRTARPLDYAEDRYGVSVKGEYSDFADKVQPNGSAIVSKRFADGTFGVLLAGNYSRRSLREDRFQASSGYRPTDFTRSNGEKLTKVATPTSLDFNTSDTLRERMTFSGAAQWQPNDRFELVVDGLYTRLKTDESQAMLYSQARFQRSAVDVDSIQVDADNTVTYLDATWQTRLMDRRADSVDAAWVVGANAKYSGDTWRGILDFSYSRGKSTFDTGQAILQPVVRTIFDDTAGNYVPSLRYPGGIDQDSFGFRNFYFESGANRGTNWAVRADVEQDATGGALMMIKAGVRVSSQRSSATRADLPYFPYGNAAAGWPAIGGNKRAFPVGDFLKSVSGDFPRSWALPDYESYYELTNAGARALNDNLPNSYRIEEKTYAAYFQAKIDQDLGAVRMRGDFGVRFVRTEQSSEGFGFTAVQINPGNGYAEPATGGVTAQSYVRDYTNVLPSLTLRFDLTPKLVARFAAARVLTRPDFSQLSPRRTVSGFNLTGSAGNPDLRPYLATQLDASFEWYFARSGALTVGLFYKDMESFVADVVRETALPGGGDRIFSISRPENGEGAKIKGAEIGFQQSFTFLPRPLDGLGLIANYTFVDSTANFVNQVSGLTYPLEGLARHTVNLTGYYEKGPLSLRATYNYRDKFLFQAVASENNTLWTAGYGQLDASIGVEVTPNISLQIDALNLTNAAARRYYDIEERTNLYSLTGRRFLAGVRATF